MASVARAISALMVMVNFTLLVSEKRSSQARNYSTSGESGSEGMILHRLSMNTWVKS